MAVATINRAPSRMDLVVFGATLPVTTVVLGLILGHRFGLPAAEQAVTAAGLLATVAYALVPVLRRPMFIGWSVLTYPIGWAVSHLVLALVFFGVVTPIGVVLRRVGHDPMAREWNDGQDSYWTTRAARDLSSYFHQH